VGGIPERVAAALDEVYRFVRGRSDLATGGGAERWQNVMLYTDDRPSIEVGVLASGPFAPEGRVIASQLAGGRSPRLLR
jgi:hypothetical protein